MLRLNRLFRFVPVVFWLILEISRILAYTDYQRVDSFVFRVKGHNMRVFSIFQWRDRKWMAIFPGSAAGCDNAFIGSSEVIGVESSKVYIVHCLFDDQECRAVRCWKHCFCRVRELDHRGSVEKHRWARFRRIWCIYSVPEALGNKWEVADTTRLLENTEILASSYEWYKLHLGYAILVPMSRVICAPLRMYIGEIIIKCEQLQHELGLKQG